jgi:glycine/D-amino acid oxidase-like deaminating enzyme
MAAWDVVVIGAGIVGVATAYYLARAGVRCLVLERTGPAAEASGANAGFIGYAHGLETGTVEFVKASLSLLFELAEEGEEFDLAREGYLLVALTRQQLDHLRELRRRAVAAGLRSELLEGTTLRALEPALGNGVLGGLYLADAGHIDPVRATLAFVNRARLRGAEFRFGVEVGRVVAEGDRVVGVEAGGDFYPSPNVVLAAGAWSKPLAATCGVNLPVDPARGQMLATVPLPPLTRRVIRGPEVGLRQNRAGEVVIGSTVEVDRETIQGLYEKAVGMVPKLGGAAIGRTWAGLRPMTPDLLPIVGPAPGIRGLWLATGHSRTGMSYGPGTGLAMAELIIYGRTSLPIYAFRPERFGGNPCG